VATVLLLSSQSREIQKILLETNTAAVRYLFFLIAAMDISVAKSVKPSVLNNDFLLIFFSIKKLMIVMMY
jgi:hypothetical protein